MNTPQLPPGYRAKFRHDRVTRWAHPGRLGAHQVLNERGGTTTCMLFDPSKVLIAETTAHARHDDYDKNGVLVKGEAYSKKLGRTISLGRAIHTLSDPTNDDPRAVAFREALKELSNR